MCGFVGAMSGTGALPFDEETATRARDVLSHRGPDDAGSWWSPDRNIYLGHRRLSIIDLTSAGHQPMGSDDGTLRIIYNGEVYNFQQIREELVRKGHHFRSRSDTEVLLHAYTEYGIDFIHLLRGMFAFALYDSRERTLLLARDRLGIKPLYYTCAAGVHYFASEIKSLLAFPTITREMDLTALREYLAFGKVYTPRTMLEGIRLLPAAHHAVVRGGTMLMQEYWTPYDNHPEVPSTGSEEEVADGLLDRLRESVRLRLVSDVPVGVFLSGGVDSTANVALMSEAAGGRINTYTVGFEGMESYDERKWARRAAEAFGTRHEEMVVEPGDLIREMKEIAYFLDAPVADPTVIPIFFLSRLARDSGSIVILNGDGADELFCGYTRWRRLIRFERYWKLIRRLPRPILRGLRSAAGLIPDRGVAADLFDRAHRGVPLYVGSTGALKGKRVHASLFEDRTNDPYHPVRNAWETYRRIGGRDDMTEWLSYWGVRSEVEHVFLHRADRMGMANSIEIRVPFLDHKVVEYAMSMPQHLKVAGDTSKYILKKALRGVVPDLFLDRTKQGFCVPIREWIGTELPPGTMNLLPRILHEHGGFDRPFVDEYMGLVRNDTPDGTLLWNAFCLASWYERWFVD